MTVAGVPGKEGPRPLWDSTRVPVPLDGADRLMGRDDGLPLVYVVTTTSR